MKVKKLLEQLSVLLGAETKKIIQQKQNIKLLLKQLKEEKRLLKTELESQPDRDKARQIRRKLKIVKTERKKGIKLLKTAMKKHQHKESKMSENIQSEP